MIKKIFITSIFYLLLTSNSFSAGSSGGDGGSMKSDYEKAVTFIKSAKKIRKKR